MVYPVKMLVVFLHEASHALAALISGGTVDKISLSPQEGGYAITRGGNAFAIASSGYLGSLVFGVAIFYVAVKTKYDKVLMTVLGLFIMALCGLYVREQFTLWFCLLTALGMFLMARFMSHNANDFALRIIGLTSMIYVPWDIFSDTLARPDERSDARIIAEIYGGTTMGWGAIWLATSLGLVALCLRISLGKRSNIRF